MDDQQRKDDAEEKAEELRDEAQQLRALGFDTAAGHVDRAVEALEAEW